MAEAWLEQAATNLTAKPAALPESRNWLEEAHQSLVSMEDARLRTSVNNALKSNPDEAARTKLGALTVGVPMDVAERQPQVVDLAKQSNILQKLQDTEYTKKAFADPEFAKIAHDDVDNLSFWERIGNGLKRGATNVGVTAEAMGYFIDKTLSDIGSMTLPKPKSMTDEQWAKAQEKIQVGRGAGGLSIAAKSYGAIPQDPKMKEFASVVEQQPTTMGGIGEGMAYLAQNPSVLGVLFAEQVAPLTAFGVPAGFAVSPIRKAVTDRLTNEAVKRYVAATVPMAALQFGTNAGMTFGGEMAEGISRGLTPEAAAGRASIKSVVEGAVNAAFAFAPVPVGTTRLKKAGTVAAEAVKQGVAGAAGATASAAAVGENISLAEQMLEFFGEFTTAPVDIATAALSDPGAANIVRDAAAARQAQATAAMMEQVGQAAKEGKLGKRSPEDLKRFVDGMETPEVYIEAREFAKYFQELGVDPRQVASEIPGVAEQFDEAVASGGDLRMTMGDYASKIAATEHHAALSKHIRTDPDDPTPAQAEKFEQEYGQKLQARADEILAETEERDPIIASADQVRDQITQQITSTGKFDERAAAQKAELHRAFSIVMGKELGIMPHEVYERYGLQFRVPPPSAEPTPPPGETVAGGTLYQKTGEKFISPTITINGVERPTTNSKGQPIAQTEEALRNFWKWFADSRVVDDQGRPLVMYRGSMHENAEAFSDQALIFTTEEKEFAELYGRGGKVFSIYVKAEKPFEASRNEGIRLWNRFLDETSAPSYATAGSDRGALPFWTMEPQLRKWLDGNAIPYDGIYFAESDRSSSLAVLDIKQIKSTDNIGTFSPEDPNILRQQRRGQISMAEDITQAPSVISLFEGADLSTVLHETGHFFFEVYKDISSRPDAPEKVKADMAALLSFVGVESLDKWNSMSIEERRAGHEKVAEAFEVYLFEGKAPSEGMKSLFRTYRAWLNQVYQNIKDYLSPEKITPEVRSVFDRMLASDEQIAATQKARSFIPLFTREEFTNEEEWQKYQDTVTAQTDDAVEKLERRSLRDLKWLDNAKSKEMKRLQAAGKEVRAGVKAEVDAEVRNRPVYQAMRFLSHGELADLKGLNRDARRGITEAGLTTTKLSSEALKAQYGDAPAAKWRYMPTGRYGWRTEKGGLDPDAVAEWFGFSSGDALVNALLEAEKMDTLIESITDQRMLEEHADLSDPQAIEDAANDAIHNEAHTRMVATELAKLDKKVGNLKMLLKASDEYARERIAKMKVRDLKPLQYLAAASRAARNARNAYKSLKEPETAYKTVYTAKIKKGLSEEDAIAKATEAKTRAEERIKERGGRPASELAAQAKRDQLLSGRLYRAAIEAQQNNEKALAYFKKFEKPEYLKRIDPDEQEAIVELLGRYDLRKSVTLKDIDLKEHVRQLAEDGEITEFTDIPEWVLTDKKSYKELTIEELEGLYETVRMLAAVGRNKKELIAGEERIALEDAINEMETVADKAIPKGVPNPIDKATLSMLQKAGETMRGFNAPLVKVEQLAQFLDGGIPNGPFAKYIFEPMAQAENARNKIDANALYKIVEMLDGLDGKRLMQQYEIKSLPKIDGKSQSLSVEAIMTMALNFGNESNEFKLKDGYGWTDDQVREIVSHLTAKEWEAVQGIWDAIGELWPQIVEVERSITGIAPKGVEPRPFTTPSGQQLKGGYFPVIYDPRSSAAGLKQAEAKAGAVEGQTGFFRPKVADGFTKKRITGAAGQILLTGGLSIIPQHLSEVSHLISHKKALRDAWKLLSNRKVQGIIKDKLGVDAYNQFTSWAHAVANGRAVTDDVGARWWGKWLGKLRRNISLVAMGFKYTTASAQLAGITASMEIFRQRSAENQVMGVGYLRKGVGEFTRHPFQSAKFVFSKSEQMNNRVNSFDRNIRENFERAIGKQGIMDFIRLLSMKHIGYMDMSIAIPTWTGAYRWAIDQELTETEAVAHADKIVRLSLGSGGVKDLNAAQRAASLQFVTLFFSYFATYHGRLTSILRDAKSENEVLKAHRKLDAGLRTFTLVIMAATLSELLAGRFPKCEEDDDGCYAEWAAGKSIAYLFAGIPVAREVASSLDTGHRFEGSPLLSVGKELVITGDTGAKLLAGEGEADKFMKHAMMTAGYAAGIPGLAQLNITGGYAMDLYTGEEEMESPFDARYFLIRKPKE